MKKQSVVVDPDGDARKRSAAGADIKCPACGGTCEITSQDVPWCHKCGTKPFEKPSN